MADLANKLKAAAKDGVQKSAPVTTFVGMNSVQIGSFLQEKYALQIAQLLPVTNKLSAERIISMAVMVISQNESVKACTPASIIGAVMTCAMLGFNPLPAMNQAFFIPYAGKCEFQIGYKGWLQLLFNTGQVQSIITDAVHVDDKFQNIRGTDAKIIHEPCEKLITFETFRGAYAIVNLKSGGSFPLYFPKEKIEHLRKKGVKGKTADKSFLQNAWGTDYAAMGVVKVLKALIHNNLPLSDELQTAVKNDSSIIDITAANMATKELIPVSTEDVEAVEVVEVKEIVTQESFAINPESFDDTTFYFWFEWAKQNPLIEFNHDTTQEIVRRILIGEIDIKEVPNEWLSSKAIENAVLTAEQKDKYIGKDK